VVNRGDASELDLVEGARTVLGADEVLTTSALAFVAALHDAFEPTRRAVLERRAERRRDIAREGRLDFLPHTGHIRTDAAWRVPPAPRELRDRRVEITGPPDPKMMINALNSGAHVYMTDFEDSLAPSWSNVIGGHANVMHAVRGDLRFDGAGGKHYALAEDRAVLIVRPRGWHLLEGRVSSNDGPVSAAIFDAAMYVFHNAETLLEQGSGPYLYLPKLESHLEARLWNDVLDAMESALSLPSGTIRVTVLIETITAAFEMDEILYELRSRACGLNAGRWDYMFSVVKNFRDCGPESVLPDRNAVTMTVPFMRSYTKLLVQTCRRRGAQAIGGMSAYIPNRRDVELNERAMSRVRDDKAREARDGFEGTWVAHPDLVAVAAEAFDAVRHGSADELRQDRDDVHITADDLLDFGATPGAVTQSGLRNNLAVALEYVESWLRGIGAVAIANLMEDAATAEIARSQVWQWRHNGIVLDTGAVVTEALIREMIDEETRRLDAETLISSSGGARRTDDARRLVQRLVLDDEFVDFLTLLAAPLLG